MEETKETSGSISGLTRLQVGEEIERFQETLEERSEVAVGQDQNQRQVKREKIRCFRCKEYDYFAKDCAIMKVAEKDQLDKMKQLMDTEELNCKLKLFARETYKSLIKADSDKVIH